MRQLFIALTGVLSFISLTASAVDINSADAETLARELNGVGAAKAQAIVAYREQAGGFRSPEELLNVRGIGVKILDENHGRIEVEPLAR